MSWTVIQRRLDDGSDFFQNWDSYVSGFGDPSGSFWIGLDTIHTLTSDCTTELRVNLRKQDGCVAHAHYTTFAVGDASTNYTYVGPISYSKDVPCYEWQTQNTTSMHYMQIQCKFNVAFKCALTIFIY